MKALGEVSWHCEIFIWELVSINDIRWENNAFAEVQLFGKYCLMNIKKISPKWVSLYPYSWPLFKILNILLGTFNPLQYEQTAMSLI